MQSVHQLLNKCKTESGRRLLWQWLQQPLLDLTEINLRQNIVQEFIGNKVLRKALGARLANIPDLQLLESKFYSHSTQVQDVVHLYNFFFNLLPSFILLLKGSLFSSWHLHAIFKNTYIIQIEKYYEELIKVEQNFFYQRLNNATEINDIYYFFEKYDMSNKLKLVTPWGRVLD